MLSRISSSQLIGRNKVVTFLIVAGLFLMSVLFIRQATAQDNRPTLKPPFRLQMNRAAASSVITPPPLNAPIVMSQTFDSSYVPTTNLSATGWHQVVGSGATVSYTWGLVTSGSYSNTVWVAATGLPALIAGTDTYTNGQEAMLIYGPIDLSRYGSAILTATYLLDAGPGDFLGVAASTDGQNFNVVAMDSSSDPLLSATHNNVVYNLQDYARQPNPVYIAFVFKSNTDNLNGLGAFLKATVLRAIPLQINYLPVIVKQPTPTPTPTLTPTPTSTAEPYLYNYTFSTGLASDPDVSSWGGNFYTTTCAQNGLGTSGSWGNPPSAMTIYVNQTNTICGASPNVKASTDYEYSADLYVYTGHKDARFGLIFAAGDSAFSGSAFNPSGNYYLLKIKMSTTDANSIAYYQLQEVTGGSTTATLIPETSFNTSLNIRQWNNFKVRQVGDSFTIYLNGVQLGSTVNGSSGWSTGRRKFGIYIEAKADNSDAPFEVFFDNVLVRQWP